MNAVHAPGFSGNAPDFGPSTLGPQAAPKVRVALLVHSDSVPNWFVELARKLAGCEFAELASVIVCPSSLLRSSSGWNSALFRAWDAFDRRLNSRCADAFACSPASQVSSLTRFVDLRSEPNTQRAIECLRSQNVDVILAADHRFSTDLLSSAAKHGIWFLRPAAKHVIESDDACVDTVLEAAGPDCTRVLYCAHSSRNDVSPYLADQANCWKGVQIVLRSLAALRERGWDSLCAQNAHPPSCSSVAPGNLATARFVGRWFAEAVRYEFNYRLRKEQWFIAFRPTTSLPVSAADMNGFHFLVPPRDRFYADPFVVQHEQRHYIFFEDYRYKLKRGMISFAELGSEGVYGEPEVVLDRPYHLSYPNVFLHEGQWFMLPETRDNRRVELYRATDFPRGWQLEKVLLKDVPAVDPSIFFHNGKIWMFVGGMVDNASPNDELFLFSADSLFGPWTPHPKNPVVSDVRRARPAGNVFAHAGRLIRPAQDCSRRYGFAVSFNRIDVLSESDYHETPVGYLSPEWHPRNLGTHTFNQSESFQVVDGRVLIFRP